MAQYLNDWDFEDPDLIACDESIPSCGYPAEEKPTIDEYEGREKGAHE